jgi:hypothetical protein
MAFQPKITKARIVYSPFTPDEMASIGTALAQSIKDRIRRGENAEDAPMKPLKGAHKNYVPYARQKIQKGLQGIRDWWYSGNTLRVLKVLKANNNMVQIGFANPVADRVAHFNNIREKAFGVSPKDRTAIGKAIKNILSKHKFAEWKKVA